MRVQEYLRRLRERLDDRFKDQGRQMSRSDVAVVACVSQNLAAENIDDMKDNPYEAENPEGL